MRMTGNGPPFFKVGLGKRAKVIYRRTEVYVWLETHGRTSTSG
jgi:hypothetical protein